VDSPLRDEALHHPVDADAVVPPRAHEVVGTDRLPAGPTRAGRGAGRRLAWSRGGRGRCREPSPGTAAAGGADSRGEDRPAARRPPARTSSRRRGGRRRERWPGVDAAA
jgi:hypothetical protein